MRTSLVLRRKSFSKFGSPFIPSKDFLGERQKLVAAR